MNDLFCIQCYPGLVLHIYPKQHSSDLFSEFCGLLGQINVIAARYNRLVFLDIITDNRGKFERAILVLQ